jgi:hypothetical protein
MNAHYPERLLWTAAGVVEAPVGEVTGLVLRAEAGEVDPDSCILPHTQVSPGLVLTGGPVRFGVVPRGLSAPIMFIEVDRQRQTLAVEGRWWFRGVYCFEPHPDGTLVVYRVYDIARTWRWLVPLLLLQQRLSGTFDRGGVQSQVHAFVSRIGQRLGCGVRLATAEELTRTHRGGADPEAAT